MRRPCATWCAIRLPSLARASIKKRQIGRTIRCEMPRPDPDTPPHTSRWRGLVVPVALVALLPAAGLAVLAARGAEEAALRGLDVATRTAATLVRCAATLDAQVAAAVRDGDL